MSFEKPEQPKKSAEAEDSAVDGEQKMTRRQFLGGVAAAGAAAVVVEGVSGTAQAEEPKFPNQYEVPSTEVFRKYLEQDKVEISDELLEELVQEFDNAPHRVLKEIQWGSIRQPDYVTKIIITRDPSGGVHVYSEGS